VESFHRVSVVKDPLQSAENIYFRAQMQSLAENMVENEIRLKPIISGHAGPDDFQCAEDETKRLLTALSWEHCAGTATAPIGIGSSK